MKQRNAKLGRKFGPRGPYKKHSEAANLKKSQYMLKVWSERKTETI